ncbi:MAG: hypothetical protein ACYDCO_03115 [Armatimonadota bacterium]
MYRPLQTIWRTILLGGVLCAGFGTAHAIDLTCVGSWSLTITASNLQAGAGSDLVSTYTSDTAAATLAVINTTGDADSWRVDIRRTDILWDNSLTLSARRTSDGTGGGSVSGGTVFQAIGTSDSSFFSGAGDRSGITLQFQVSGASVQLAPATYSTTITYTVVDVL